MRWNLEGGPQERRAIISRDAVAEIEASWSCSAQIFPSGFYISSVFFPVREPHQWNSPSYPIPSFCCPQLTVSSYGWLGVPCEEIAPGVSRDQQASPELEVVLWAQLRPLSSRAARLSPKSECANFRLQKLPLLSLTCPIWHHSYKSSCLDKAQEAGGGREKEFHPHGFGEAGTSLALTQFFFSGPGKLHLCNFASRLTKKVLSADSQR